LLIDASEFVAAGAGPREVAIRSMKERQKCQSLHFRFNGDVKNGYKITST